MKRFKSFLVIIFFFFSLTNLFSYYRYDDYQHHYNHANLNHNESKNSLIFYLNFAKVVSAILADNIYRQDDLVNYKIFYNIYLVLDSIDSIFRISDESFMELGVLAYNLFYLFNLDSWYSNKFNKNIKEDVDRNKSEKIESNSKQKNIDPKFQKFLIILKNTLFAGDAFSSLSQHIANNFDDESNVVSFANLGTISKILARSIDTKNCTFNKKALLALILPTTILGVVNKNNLNLRSNCSLERINELLGREETECSICMDNFNPGDRIVIVDGEHQIYHRDCLNNWIRTCEENYNEVTNPLTGSRLNGVKKITLS